MSNIFPSVANWFASPGPPTNNGSVRRRRDSESESDEEQNADNTLPQSKRRRSDVVSNFIFISCVNRHFFNDFFYLLAQTTAHQTPSTSNSRRLSMPVNATPADQLRRNRLGQMTSSPYDFAARNPSMTLMASPIQINDSESEEDDETDEVQLVQQENATDEEISSKSVSKRKGIHETQFNVLRMSNTGDRSTSEPPTNAQAGPSRAHRFGYGLQNEVIPENFTMNGNDEATSEADFTHPRASRHAEQRLSGFLGNRNKNISASTGQLSFQAHLETEKSLFAEQRRQFNPSVYGSSWSLNSGGSGSRFHRNFSPFYGGQTMYGGAAAYSRRDNRLQQTLRVPTMIRPSSRLSNASSSSSVASIDGSNASGTSGNQQVGLSNTSKRILELLNQCTSPLKDARKMGTGLNASVRVPSLMNNNRRFNETDLSVSRAVRLTQPKTPYSRPTAPLPPTSDLQIPSISQLLQMKRLLNSTAEVKKLASQSKSTLNEASAYTLPGGDPSSGSCSTNKYTNKVKEKLTATREKQTAAPVIPVNLPNIQLPDMKSVPKIDISLPAPKPFISTTPKVTTNSFTIFGNKAKNDVVVIDDDDSDDDEDDDEDEDEEDQEEEEDSNESNNNNVSMQFKFSSPVPILSKQVPANTKSSDSSKNFKFSNPLSVGNSHQQLETLKPDLSQAKKKEAPAVVVEKPVAPSSSSGIASAPELKQGSCLEALFGKKADDTVPKDTPMGFGTQFKMATTQWECPACMIRNDNATEKCVACNSAKPGGGTSAPKAAFKTTDSGFANLVATQKAKWSCPTCMSQNDQSAEKCLACTEPKPGGSKPEVKKVETKAPVVAMDNSFKMLVEKQKANWQCASCFTQNEQMRMKCACCEEAKPGSAPEKVPQFSFNSGTKFSFGVPPKDAAASSKESSFVFGAKPETQNNNKGFSFGSSSSTSTTVTKADTGAKPTFSFGVPNSSSTTATKASTDAVSSSTVNSKPASGGFSFGVTSSVPTPKSEAAISAADTSSSPRTSNKRQLDETDNVAKPSSPATFSFGKNEAQAKPAFSSPSSFGASSSNNNKVSSSGGFSFQKPASPSVTTAATSSSVVSAVVKDDSSSQISSTATTNAITAPLFGSGMSGIKPLDRSAFGGIKPQSSTTSSNDDAKKMIFGAAKKDEGIKASTGGFTFGQSSTMKPADTSSIFGGAAKANETAKPGFSFMSPNVPDKPAENKSTFGMFGNATAATSPKPASFGFNAEPAKPEVAKPVFGSGFGGTPTATDANKSIFGAPAAPPASPFLFGAQANSQAPAFNNASASQSATPLSGTPSGFGTPTPSSNIFGSVNNSPAFGQPSTENKLPAFGAPPAFGAANQSSPFGGSAATGGSRTASSVSSPFGANDEPNNKKLNTGFQFNAAAGPNTASTGSSAGVSLNNV